ncbi:hypothetical protein EDB80DRAFT_779772 [Ilyonectria destructans]|nr:hypothetical protein EDB80DRAFT_779772 [Ilyonectria destructans]
MEGRKTGEGGSGLIKPNANKRKRPQPSDKGKAKKEAKKATKAPVRTKLPRGQRHKAPQTTQTLISRLTGTLRGTQSATNNSSGSESSEDESTSESNESSDDENGRTKKRQKDTPNTNQKAEEDRIIESQDDDTADEDAVQPPRRIVDQEMAQEKANLPGIKVPVAVGMNNEDGDPVEVATLGPYDMRIWEKGMGDAANNRSFSSSPPEAIRILTETMGTFWVVTRACSMMSSSGTQTTAEARLAVEKPFSNSVSFSRAFVGFSARLLADVYMSPGKTGGVGSKVVKLLDDATGVQFKTEPGSKLCAGNLIWHEKCLVPTVIGTIKNLIEYDTPEKGTSDKDARAEAWVFLGREHRRSLKGLSPVPYGSRLPSPKGSRQPNVGCLYREASVDTHYMLQWPPLAVLKVPQGFVKIRKGPSPPIHPPPLGVFIIYFPQLLRFTEVRRLTRYIHPARFAEHNYRLDRECEAKAMTVDYDGLEVVTLAALVAKIRSTSAEVPATTRVPLLPQSMPGSQMVWPLGVTRGEPPSDELSNLCLLNDIRVLGIPSYHKRDGNYMQMVGLPMRWAVKWVRDKRQWQRVSKQPASAFWHPGRKAKLVSLTGPFSTIGPVFADLEPALLEEEKVSEQQGSWEWDDPSTYLRTLSLDGIIDRRLREDIARTNNARLRVALGNGAFPSDLRFDEDDWLLRWAGMGSAVTRAAANNQLGKMAAAPIIWKPQEQVELPVVVDLTGPEEAQDPSARWASEELKKEVMVCLSCTGAQPRLYATIRELLEPGDPVGLVTLFQYLQDFTVEILRPLQQIVEFIGQDEHSEAKQEEIEKLLPLTVLRFFGAIDFDEGMPPDTSQHWHEFTKNWTDPENKKISQSVSMMMMFWGNTGSWSVVRPTMASLMAIPNTEGAFRGGLRAWDLATVDMEVMLAEIKASEEVKKNAEAESDPNATQEPGPSPDGESAQIMASPKPSGQGVADGTETEVGEAVEGGTLPGEGVSKD